MTNSVNSAYSHGASLFNNFQQKKESKVNAEAQEKLKEQVLQEDIINNFF